MSNRYDAYIKENEAEIENLKGRIERFKARGVRLSSIPAIEEEIKKLEKQIVTFRGTSKMCKALYGQ